MRQRGRRAALVAIGIGFLATVARATDHQVPSQFATIQAAIVAAAPGDRVLVQPGTYPEHLSFLGKGIEVIGVGGAEVTTIDATGLRSSCVAFVANEPPEALLEGFTLTGGTGINPGAGLRGGGIYLESGARPVIQECVITGNTAKSGGGIAASVLFSDVDAAHFIDCVIANNQAVSSGGGLLVTFTGITPEFGEIDGQPVFEGCSFVDNVAGALGGGASGGGVFLDCLFEGNVAEEGGGAFNAQLFERTTLRGNTATEFGGGYYSFAETHAALAGATLLENTAPLGGGAVLDVFEFPTDSTGGPPLGPKLTSATGCVFARNVCTVGGDGLYIVGLQSPTTTVTNCSFDGDAIVSTGGDLDVVDSIFWNVTGAFTLYSGTVAVHHSDVQGGWPGVGNFDHAPLWVDPFAGDYHLQPCSACINTGDAASPLDPDGSPADVGAVAYDPWTGLGGGVAGTFGQSELSGLGPLMGGESFGIALSQAAPRTSVLLFAGATSVAAPFKGGTFWPTPSVMVALPTDGSGALQVNGTWPPGLVCGFTLYLQAWWPDAGAPAGFAGSNGLRAVAP